MPRRAHLGLDAVLGLELRQELVGLEGLAQDLDLALHRGEVARRQLVQRGQPLALLGGQRGGVAAQRLGHEHALALLAPSAA